MSSIGCWCFWLLNPFFFLEVVLVVVLVMGLLVRVALRVILEEEWTGWCFLVIVNKAVVAQEEVVYRATEVLVAVESLVFWEVVLLMVLATVVLVRVALWVTLEEESIECLFLVIVNHPILDTVEVFVVPSLHTFLLF